MLWQPSLRPRAVKSRAFKAPTSMRQHMSLFPAELVVPAVLWYLFLSACGSFVRCTCLFFVLQDLFFDTQDISRALNKEA